MSYLDIERQQEVARQAVVDAVIAAVKHRVHLSPDSAKDGELIYEWFAELYDREAERIADDGKQLGYVAICKAFPIISDLPDRDLPAEG